MNLQALNAPGLTVQGHGADAGFDGAGSAAGGLSLEAQVQNLIQAMASFAPEGAGVSTLPDNQRPVAAGSLLAVESRAS